MLKVLVLSLIFATCVMMGIIKRQEFYRRGKELESFITFAEYAKNEIFYHRTPLDVILKNNNVSALDRFFCNISNGDGSHILRRYEASKFDGFRNSALKSEDIQCIDRLFSLLCNAYDDEQMKLLDCVISDLKIKRDDAVSDMQKFGNVYLKMGIAAGAFAVMICI